MSGLFWFSMGVMCTIAVVILRNKWLHRTKYLNPYLEILKHAKDNKLKFKQRLGDVVYFTGYKSMDIIYNLRRGEISAFKNDNCVLVSVESIKDVNNEIIEVIEKKFYKEIYKDITLLNGVAYSNNIIETSQSNPLHGLGESPNHKVGGKDSKPMIEFVVEDDIEMEDDDKKMDRIVQKIKQFGIDSLTAEEKEFIKDADNW